MSVSFKPTTGGGMPPAAATSNPNPKSTDPTTPSNPPSPKDAQAADGASAPTRAEAALHGRNDDAAHLDRIDKDKRKKLRASHAAMQKDLSHRLDGVKDDAERTRIKRNARTRYYAKHHAVVDDHGVVWSASYDKKKGELRLSRRNDVGADGSRIDRERIASDDGSRTRRKTTTRPDGLGGSQSTREEVKAVRNADGSFQRTGRTVSDITDTPDGSGGHLRRVVTDGYAGDDGAAHTLHAVDETTFNGDGSRLQTTKSTSFDPATGTVIRDTDRTATTDVKGAEDVKSMTHEYAPDGRHTSDMQYFRTTRPGKDGPSEDRTWHQTTFDGERPSHEWIDIHSTTPGSDRHEVINIDHHYDDTGASTGSSTKRDLDETHSTGPDGVPYSTSEHTTMELDGNGQVIYQTKDGKVVPSAID